MNSYAMTLDEIALVNACSSIQGHVQMPQTILSLFYELVHRCWVNRTDNMRQEFVFVVKKKRRSRRDRPT